MTLWRHRQPTILAVDGNYLPMLEVSRRHGLKAVATGRAQVLDLRTWDRHGRLEGHEAVRVIVYPGARAVAEAKLALGRGPSAILRRDGFRCAYCAGRATTVDHVVPRCQGGPSTWANLVACCFPCNQKKGGRTPEEARMALLFPIRSPRHLLFQKFQELVAAA